jgi:flagellar hook protein FlgE
MGLQNALFTGVSGLTTYSNVISIIGNNIANVNTPGFKESRGNFSDILSQSSGSSGNLQIGRGVRMNRVDQLFTQGGFQATSQASDLAIDGEGFFLVKDPKNESILYTRTGNFTLDREGRMVNSQGLIVQGFDVDSNGNALPFVRDIQINGQAFPPQVTSQATININLNVNTEVTAAAFDPTDPVATSDFSTALGIYDSLGNPHTVEIYFEKTADSNWTWYLAGRASDIDLTTTNDLVTLAQGEMVFNGQGGLESIVTTDQIDYSTGALTTLTTPLQGAVVSFNFAEGAEPDQEVTFSFGQPQQIIDSTGTFVANPDAPDRIEGTTQLGSPSSTLFQSQDGFGSGVLQSYSVDEQGIVRGLFSNGQTLDLLQVALAKFPSNNGLNLVGKNLFSQSQLSGDPVVSAPGSSGLGVVVSNSLEISNVDLSSQFVELIRAQQAFQANARVITTGDELLTEVVNLQR